jgi:hypothetical protein
MNPKPSLSKEYHHKGSPVKKRFRTKASVGKHMATVFWNVDGIIHMDFLGPPSTRVVYCNTQNYETRIKKSLEVQEEHFAAT